MHVLCVFICYKERAHAYNAFRLCGAQKMCVAYLNVWVVCAVRVGCASRTQIICKTHFLIVHIATTHRLCDVRICARVFWTKRKMKRDEERPALIRAICVRFYENCFRVEMAIALTNSISLKQSF